MDNINNDTAIPRLFTNVNLRSRTGKRLRRAADFLNIDPSDLIDLLLDYADIPHIYGTTIHQEYREKFKTHTEDRSNKYSLEKEKYFKEGFKYAKRRYEW